MMNVRPEMSTTVSDLVIICHFYIRFIASGCTHNIQSCEFWCLILLPKIIRVKLSSCSRPEACHFDSDSCATCPVWLSYWWRKLSCQHKNTTNTMSCPTVKQNFFSRKIMCDRKG